MRAIRYIFLVGLGAAAIAAAAGAQEHTVVFDGSFGSPGNAYRIADDDGAGLDYRIDYCPSCTEVELPGGSHGELIGDGLFQSLLRLDVNDGDTATFAASKSSAVINHIFARVTGEGGSEIFGRLRSDVGTADLYLMNPYGVMFGPNASLDVGRSFYVSTADVLRFDNGQEFEARSGGAIPMAVAAVVEFGFLDDGESPETITFDRTRNFGVDPGNTLSAVAGRVEIIGRGDDTVTLFSEGGGDIQLAAVPAGTDVPVKLAVLTAADVRSDEAAIHFSKNGTVVIDRTVTAGPGRIVIRGGRFEMVLEQGDMKSGTVTAIASAGMPDGPTAIDIEVAGTIFVDRGDIKSVTQGPASGGASGDIRLVSSGISLRNGAEVVGEIGESFHAEHGPSIRVQTGTLEIESGAVLATQDDLVAGTTSGKVGDIWVEAESIVVDGTDSEISTTSKGIGSGGIVHLDADTIALENGGAIQASRLISLVPSGVPMDFGRIEIFADQLSVTGGSEILASTETNFDGPDGPDLYIGIQPGGESIPVQTVTVSAGRIVSVTDGSDKGGDVTVHAGQILLSSDPDIENSTGQISAVTQGAGPGGNLSVYADSIDLIDGGQMRTSTQAGAGRAGDLTVEVTGRLFASGTTTVDATTVSSGLFSRGADEDGGNLTISADSIELERGADISTSAFGDGKPGDMLLTARAISVTGGTDSPTSIAAKSDGGDRKGDGGDLEGGDLTIDTDMLAVAAGGEITTSTSGKRNAGDVLITAREILVEGTNELGFNRSGITSRSLQNSTGRAGSVTLQPHAGERLTLRIGDRGRASVESQGFGAAGDLLITGAALIDVSGGGEISATVGDVSTDDPGGPAAVASDIRIRDTDTVRVTGGQITAATSGSGFGGSIDIAATNVELSGGSSITTQSTADGGGDAGNIVIAAAGTFQAVNSAITTTAKDAGGGRISIQAGSLVYLLDSQLETSVQGEEAGEDAGDIDIPLRGDEPDSPAPVVPEFVVINRSSVIANAKATDAGNITIAASNVVISSDSIIEATSETGLSGEIQISAPDTDIVSQVAPLPSSFVDPSDRLLPPCVARTERTGSFMVQNREALPRPLDAPLPSTLGGAPGVDGIPPESGSTDCSVFQERS